MAKTTPAAYVANKVTQLAAITNGSGTLFAHVGRSAGIDIDRIRKIPNFPAALLCNLGGELSDANNEIWEKQLSVTIIRGDVFDTMMDSACEWLDLATEKVIDALQADRTNGGIICVFQSDDAPIVSDDDMNLVMRSLVFAYRIDRVVT